VRYTSKLGQVVEVVNDAGHSGVKVLRELYASECVVVFVVVGVNNVHRLFAIGLTFALFCFSPDSDSVLNFLPYDIRNSNNNNQGK